jgi:hypothetical protein
MADLPTSNDRSVYAAYSGRGMFGGACFGVVFRTVADFAGFMVALTQENAWLASDLADRVQTDSMGLDTIYYFPGYQLDGDSAFE